MSTPPHLQPSSSRPPTKAESSGGDAENPADSDLDALPPAPPSGSGKPPATLAFPDTQTSDSAEGRLQIPGYEILGELGRGGMGVVYKARQIKLGRLVALKMSRSGEMTTEDLARFRAEAEAVARLRHGNIVQIFEVGECQGRPFFAFEYVDGGSLADFLRGTPQPARASAELVEKLARAMHAAHLAGIIHRDLKPANVLLSNEAQGLSGQNDAAAVKARPAGQPPATLPMGALSPLATPKIADFGVAKRLDKHSLHTATGAVLGTPNYMAPEQAWGSDKRRPVGPPADVYALGAILYEMITGRPPFLGETPLDTLQQVVMQEPVPPTRLQPKLSKDLETVCLKCLQKEPGRRYSTAEELADDLRRFLEDRPTRAKAAGPLTRVLRWRRRNPAVAALLVVAVLLLLAGTAVSTYFSIQANLALGEAKANADRAKDNARQAESNLTASEKNARKVEELLETAKDNVKRAEDNEKLAQDSLRERDRLFYGSKIALAHRALLEKEVGQTLELLDNLIPTKADGGDLRNFEWYYLRRRCGGKPFPLQAHNSPVLTMAFSPDNSLVATANAATTSSGQKVPVEICLWQPQSGRRRVVFKGHSASVNSLAFRNDGKRLASASDDGTVKVWDVETGDRSVFTCQGEGAFTCVQFMPDGKSLVTSSVDKTVRFWNADNGDSMGAYPPLNEAVEWVALHPSGETVAAACRDGTILVWDTARGRELNRFKGSSVPVVHLAWHPKGKQLAAASADGSVRVWDVTTNELVAPPLHHHTARVNKVAFSPDGNYLASVSDDGTLQLFSAGSLTHLKTYSEHQSEVCCLAYANDGGLLASGAKDGKLYLRPFSIKPPALVYEKHSAGVCDVAWNEDFSLLASCRGLKFAGAEDPRAGSEVILWHTDVGRPRPPLTGHAMCVYQAVFQPKGMLLATCSHDGTIRFWDPKKGEEIKVLSKQSLPYYALAWSPDGSRLAATSDVEEDGRSFTHVTIWNLTSGKQIRFVHPQYWMDSLVWSPDGKWLAGASMAAKYIWLWQADSGELVHTFKGHSAEIMGLAFSPDSRWLASASADETARIWDVKQKKEWLVLTGHKDVVRAVAFHPNGIRLATASDDKLVKLWDLETRQEILSLSGHTAPVVALAFRPDGHQLATASKDTTVRIWDATPHAEDAVGKK